MNAASLKTTPIPPSKVETRAEAAVLWLVLAADSHRCEKSTGWSREGMVGKPRINLILAKTSKEAHQYV